MARKVRNRAQGAKLTVDMKRRVLELYTQRLGGKWLYSISEIADTVGVDRNTARDLVREVAVNLIIRHMKKSK